MDRALIIDKRYDEYRQKVHLEKLNSMRPATDTTSPPTFAHLDNKKKKVQIQKETLGKYDYENRVLVKKLAEITRKPSAIDNHNPDFFKYKKSLNKEKRQRDLDRITAENYAFVKRMIQNPPSYTQTSWQEERDKQLKYLKNSSQYPVLNHHVKVGNTANSMKSPKEVTITLGMKPLKIDSTKGTTSPKKIDPLRKSNNSTMSDRSPSKVEEDSEDEDEEEDEDSMDITDSEEEGDQ